MVSLWVLPGWEEMTEKWKWGGGSEHRLRLPGAPALPQAKEPLTHSVV